MSEDIKRPNPFIEAKNLIQKAMKENNRTPEDVTRDLALYMESDGDLDDDEDVKMTINPLLKARLMLQQAMKENGRTADDVKRDIDIELGREL